MLNENVNELIGLPWGFRDGCIDCGKLAIQAQKLIRGINIPYPYIYDDLEGLYAVTRKHALPELHRQCEKLKEPSLGVLGVLQFTDEMPHIITFVSPYEFLYIPLNNTSRITRLTKPFQRRLTGLFWYKGVR